MRTLPLLLCALLGALPAAARDAVLVKAKGKVSVKADGTDKFVKTQEGATLLYGDTVRVGKNSVAQLTMGENAAVLVREDSEFLIGGSAAQTELDFSFGEFLVGLRKKLTQKQSFRLRTPAAVAAIRGTLFWGKSDKKTKSSTYAGFGGQVRVEAQGQAVEVTPGKTVTVAFGSAPADPVPSTVTLDYAGKFMVDGTLQGLETLARETEPGDAVAPAPAPAKAPAKKKKRVKKAAKADAEPSLKPE
ncbi:MAG: LipL45-related lipoprotein [Elusimicrobia bacterium]|nr:MAG: LipL45-related lipoprotein [Elusimicrobiota bacterium]